MSDFVTRYEHQFHEAARRVLPRRRQPFGRRRRRIALAAFAALAAAGVPAAADNAWFPFAGRSDAPSSTREAPAAGVRGELAVLRRAQTAEDRSAATYALRFFGATFGGVQVDYIRRAGSSTGTDAVILVPAETHQLTPQSPVERDVVCMWRTDLAAGNPAGGGRACFSAAQIDAGRAMQSVGRRLDMLVPDSVARVEAISRDGIATEVSPVDNVASWADGWPARVVWYDSGGQEVRTIATR